MTHPILKFKSVWRSYSTVNHDIAIALKNINFTIQPGDRVFITGHSGAGKSTLFRLISLLEKPTNGEILVTGKNIALINPIESASYRQQIAMVPQDPMLLTDRNVLENVMLSLQITNIEHEKIVSLAESALNQVQLSKQIYSNPLALSAGEQQRVALARALARRPKILLADEPTGNLDPTISKNMMDRLLAMNEQTGSTLLIATHEATIVEEFCTKHHFRQIKLNHGSVQSDQ